MINFGNVPASSVLPVYFTSYDGATGASEAITGLAVTDVEIYKGVSITQRSSDAGIALIDTDGIDVDGVVGFNGFSIDLGDNTDAGFYAVGSFYTVVVASVTADGQTVNFIAATFRIVAASDGLSAQAKADVNAEVLDVLNTDTFAEPGQGAPGATISLAAKLGYLYKAFRNRHTQTASEFALYADNAVTKDHEAVVSDDGTVFDRGEITTGA